jgi:N-acyl homoserine lactone hydrolase
MNTLSFSAAALAIELAFSQSALAGPELAPTNVGTVERLYRVDCGRSLANDESIWTPGQNIGKAIEFSSTCYLIRHGNDVLMWDTGVPQEAVGDPNGWSTIPSLIVYHLDKTLTSQLAAIELSPNEVNYVLVSHTHGDHIGNLGLFPNATVVMQKAEYDWINAPPPSDLKLNTLVTLARSLLGQPHRLNLISGDVDLFRDGSVTLIATPGHTPGSPSLLVHLRNSGYIILSGDVAHLEENFQHDIVPSLNVDKTQSVGSMERVKELLTKYNAVLFINHDKQQADGLKLLPEYYD